MGVPSRTDRRRGLTRAAVEPPVHLLGLQRLVEALEQARLGRRLVLDTRMVVPPVDVPTEMPGEQARAIVGDQKGGFSSGQHLCAGVEKLLAPAVERLLRDSGASRNLHRWCCSIAATPAVAAALLGLDGKRLGGILWFYYGGKLRTQSSGVSAG